MASSVIASIPKLKGRANYEEWAFAVTNYLILEDMQACISEEGQANDAKARAKIILTIDPSIYVHIKEEITAKNLWEKLKRMYDDTGFTRRISLLRSLISIRLENCESMSQYVTSIVETSQRLKNTDFKITEEWVGSLLLAGLPEKFAPMIMAIEHSGMSITTDAIKSKLLDFDDQSEVSGSNGTQQNAFVSKGWQHKNRRGHESQNTCMTRTLNEKKIKCFKCKRTGHYKNQCDMQKKTQTNAFSATFLSAKFNTTDIYIDSGASRHLTAKKEWLKKVSTNTGIEEIVIADKSKIAVESCGEIQITTTVNGTEYEIPITEVLYVPRLATNLLSVSQLVKKGNRVVFNNSCCMIYNRKNELVATADQVEGVYKLNLTQVECLFTPVSERVWHRRLAHLNSKDLEKMKDGAVTGMSYTEKSPVNKKNCIVCCEGKQARLPFSHSGNRSDELLHTIHSDIAGPMEIKSIGGSKYFLLFVDDYSRMVFVYFLKTKDQALECFKTFKVMAENQTGKKIKILRTDNGLEYCNKQFDRYLEQQGIIHQKTNPYTPQQNGMCERLNRTVVEKAKCLLFDARLTKRFWAEAVNTAVYLRNRSVASGLNNKTPLEIWTGTKPDVSHLRIFGSKVMVHIPKERRLKWDRKAQQCILVGYPDNVKGYRVYNPNNNSITTSRDVVVIEEGIQKEQDGEHPVSTAQETISFEITEEKPETSENTKQFEHEQREVDVKEEDPIYEDAEETPEVLESESEAEETPEVAMQESEEQEVFSIPEPIRKKSSRVRRQPDRYGLSSRAVPMSHNVSAKVNGEIDHDEITLQEALYGPESAQWKRAMDDELESFRENDAWKLVSLPVDSTVVPCKWVFRHKLDSDNNVTYRARLVAKGFVQKPGIDFDETFSSVLRHSSLRLLFALAVSMNLEVTHLDVKTAFLNGFLKENVYMQIPVGYDCKDRKDKVLKLKRAIYGLKQSSRAWYQRVDDFLQKIGFKRSEIEPCLYTKINNKVKIVIALYVDDFFIFSNCTEETEDLKNNLSSVFKIKDLGCVKQCLGMRVRIDRERGLITLDQEQYIEKLLSKFNLQNCKSIRTPIEPKLNLEKGEINNCNTYPYQQLIGLLMYLAVLTRPDIVFSVNYLSQFNNCYTEEHWAHAKRVLKYLKTTKSLCLRYSSTSNLKLKAFVDADWASNTLDRRSYTGFFFTLCGGAVSWETRKQATVALSSTEAEYIGISDCCKEALFLRNLRYEITREMHSIPIFNDNQSAQKIANNNGLHKRTKHIDIRYHFFRENIINNIIKLEYLPTSEMPADLLTNGLNATKHYKFLEVLGLINL